MFAYLVGSKLRHCSSLQFSCICVPRSIKHNSILFCSLLCSSQGYSLSAVNWNNAAIRLPVKTNSWLFQKAGSTTLPGIGCRISIACCCVPPLCRTVARHLLSLRLLCRCVLTFVAVQSSAHYISHQLPCCLWGFVFAVDYLAHVATAAQCADLLASMCCHTRDHSCSPMQTKILKCNMHF